MTQVSRRTVLNSAGFAAAGLALPADSLAATAEGDETARLLGQSRILLKRAIVLTLDPAVGDFASGDVLIENGRIARIAPNIDASPDSAFIAELPNRIIIPGFVDTHSHSYQGLLRSLLPSGVVDPDYNRDIQNNLTLHYRPEDVYAGVLITALAMIDNGTTTIVDISQIAHTPEHSDANIRALQDAGIRAVFAYSRGAPGSRYPDDLIRLRTTWFNSTDQLLTVAMATSVDPKTFEFARRIGVRSVLHIRVDSGPLLALGRAGLLRPGDEFIHCTHLTPEAWALIRDTGGRTSHSPPLEMAMGHGYPAIQDCLDHGLRPSLSSDHSATVAQDMFGIMRTAFDLQRLAILQRAMRKEQNLPPLLKPRDVLSFATIEGARCAALDSKIGTLTPGKEADLVVLRADRFDTWPRNNAYSTVASLMNPGHVEAVFIAGKAKKWRGSLVGVDAARVLGMVEQSRNEVLRRGNFTVPLLG
ncbi:MAG: amidohydrolase family protein [Alphaproteobacteria bacterium]|nr:amidohydrolase family protein [Alphaproteobacteria bacterium]